MRNKVRKKVMVVDDDVLWLKISRARLEGSGYDVITSERAIGTSLILGKSGCEAWVRGIALLEPYGEIETGVEPLPAIWIDLQNLAKRITG